MSQSVQQPSIQSRVLVLLYSISAYLAFLAVFMFFIGWSVGIILPWTVDGPALWFQTSTPFAAVAVNIGLVVLFGLQHSTMARQPFKSRLARVVPKSAERATFVWISNLMLAMVILCWQPLPGELWHAEGALHTIMLAVNLAGWLILVGSTFMVDHFEFIGLRQAWDHLRHRTPEPPAFVTAFAYRFVRHPMMTGMMIGLWVVPIMSWGHLVLSGALSTYILVGTRFEEQDLIRTFGDRYRQYRARVPMLFPRPGSSVSPTSKPTEVTETQTQR